MESLLGFELDFWDYATFAVLALLVLAGLISVVWLAGLPGRIAIARKHPDAEAVKMMGYAGFLAAVPWIQAFIWAFKPTDIVDIRRFPAQEAKGIEEEIARLSGKPVPTEAKPAEVAKPTTEAALTPAAEPPAKAANKES
jgi:hypothetical protein